MVLTWISGFNAKVKFALYCSDVSGAFDRVKRERLIAKLRAKRMPEVLVGIFDAWLQNRVARVVVGGQRSDPMILQDVIYQGTVWGPWVVEHLLRGYTTRVAICIFLRSRVCRRS